MYVVMILEAAHEDLRNIVAYISNENPDAAETLGRARSSDEPRIVAVSRFASQKMARSLKTHPWELSNLLPDQGTETGCRYHSFQAWRTDQMTTVDSWANRPTRSSQDTISETMRGYPPRLASGLFELFY